MSHESNECHGQGNNVNNMSINQDKETGVDARIPATTAPQMGTSLNHDSIGVSTKSGEGDVI